MSDTLHNRKATAARLSMSVRRLIELDKAGQIRGVVDGGSVKYTDSEIARYIASLPTYEPGHSFAAPGEAS